MADRTNSDRQRREALHEPDLRPVCPLCGSTSWPGAERCEDCGAGLLVRMRWFCAFCGNPTQRQPDQRDGKVRCAAHADLEAEVDLIPADPVESLPTMAEGLSTHPTGLSTGHEPEAA